MPGIGHSQPQQADPSHPTPPQRAVPGPLLSLALTWRSWGTAGLNVHEVPGIITQCCVSLM